MDPQPTPSWRGAKFVWRAVLIFNLGLGAYLFTRPTSKKERKSTPPVAAETPPPPIPPPEPQYYEPIPEPVKLPDPEPEPLTVEQQRSVFEWMLEEKRKVNPQNRQEKKRINEEKAILKEFLRADIFPKI